MKQIDSLKNTRAKLILLTTTVISSVGFFAGSFINSAAPKIQEDLGISISTLQWITNSYTLMLGIFILIAGALSDKLSRRKFLEIGILIFAFASLAIFFANDVRLIILFRFIQGFGAALFAPQSLAIINNLFENKIKGVVIGIWSGITGMVSIFAPILGGIIIDAFTWKYTFLFLFPLAMISLFLTRRYIPEEANKSNFKIKNLDISGAILLLASLSFTSYGIIQMSESGITISILFIITLGLILLASFLINESRSQEPLISISILKYKHILSSNFFTFVVYGILPTIFFFINLIFQQIYGLSVTSTSLYLLPISIIITLCVFISGRFADRYSANSIIFMGGLFVSLGIFLLRGIGNDFEYFSEIFPSLVLIGLGFGIFIPSLTKLALDVQNKYSGAASGLNNSIARYAPLVALAMFSFLHLQFYTNDIEDKFIQSYFLEENQELIILNNTDQLLEVELDNFNNDEQLIVKNKFLNPSFITSFREILIPASSLVFISSIIILYFGRLENSKE